jgi:hypothetical protein
VYVLARVIEAFENYRCGAYRLRPRLGELSAALCAALSFKAQGEMVETLGLTLQDE